MISNTQNKLMKFTYGCNNHIFIPYMYTKKNKLTNVSNNVIISKNIAMNGKFSISLKNTQMHQIKTPTAYASYM